MSSSMMSKFEVIERMVNEVAASNCPSLIISGPAGVGKTFTVVKALRHYMSSIAPLMGIDVSYDSLSGTMTPINLYKKLYANRAKGSVLILDDMDSVFSNESSLNLLKAALDLNDNKTIGYFSESHVLNRENIPNEFEFQGSVIFLTNIDFNDGPKSLRPHLSALLSRSHYVDLGLRSPAEMMAWIVKTINETDIISDLDETDRQDLMAFLITNQNSLNELSLRMVKKLASLSRMGPGWQDVANVTCLAN